MKQNNGLTGPVGEKLKRECDMCKIQYDSWISDFQYDAERDEKVRSSVNKYCLACRRLKER